MASGFWRDEVHYRTREALDLLCALEDTRRHLEAQPAWTSLLVVVSDQEAVLYDKLAP